MRLLWKVIVVLLIATGIGFLLKRTTGFALFAFQEWTLEMPLWAFLVSLFILFVVFMWVYHVLRWVFLGKGRIKEWWQRRKQAASRYKTSRGLLHLAEGEWKKAEKYLIQALPMSENPHLNYLSAAKAAEAVGALERRDHYLKSALESSKESEFAVRLTEAKLQYHHGQLKEAVTTLRVLQEISPHHPEVLKLLCSVYQDLGDYDSMYRLLPKLKKEKVLSLTDLEKLEIIIYQHLFAKKAEEGLNTVNRFWKCAPRMVQQNKSCVTQYVKILIELGAIEEAEQLLRTSIKRQPEDEYFYLYGVVQENPKKQLAFIEPFYKQYPYNASLFLTLGKLCLRLKLWGKARDYLEQSIHYKPSPEAYNELAIVYEELGLMGERDTCYKKGLSCALEKNVSQPS